MNNFRFHNPTKILFGRGQIAALTQEIPPSARVLLAYGQGSIKANGVYEQIRSALSRHTVVDFGGIEANPVYETLLQGLQLIREHKLDYVLAAGGGSVLDGCKLLVAAAPYAGEPWDIVVGRHRIERALPLGTVLTLPGTGSEANGASVISRREPVYKRAFISPHVYPRFSVLDPETTFSLPERQVANGLADAFTHVLEQYLTYPVGGTMTDRLAESVLLSLVHDLPPTIAQPDYDLRANLMWTCTLALNGLLSTGVPGDWATHAIGHELTALHGIDHARTLAIVLPSLMGVQRVQKREKILQLGARVFGITLGNADERIDLTIEAVRAFYEGLGLRTRLRDYNVGADTAAVVARRLTEQEQLPLGEREDIDAAKVETILRQAA